MQPDWGWHAFILPFMDAGTVTLDFALPKFSPGYNVESPNEQLVGSRIPYLYLPQYIRSSQPPADTGSTSRMGLFHLPRHCMGAMYDPEPATNPNPNPVNPNIPRSPQTECCMATVPSGKFSDVRDGTSKYDLIVGDSLFGYWADSFQLLRP